MGIASGGSGIGTMLLPILGTYLIDEYGWRGTFLILSGIGLQGIYAGLLFKDVEKASIRQEHSGTLLLT